MRKSMFLFLLCCLSGIISIQAEEPSYTITDNAISEPLNNLTGDPARGRLLAKNRNKGNCISCHQLPIPEEKFHGTIGPALYDISNKFNAADLRLRIVDMQRLNPFTIMPSYYLSTRYINRIAPQYEGTTILSAQEVEDLIAYLKTLKAPDKAIEANTLPIPDGLKSGYEFISQEAREMQDDDFQNPGYELIELGKKLFARPCDDDKSCASCHGADGEQLSPASIAQYPKFIAELGKPLTLRDQIQRCWENQLDNLPLLYDDRELLALETFLRYLAQGEKVNVDVSGPMKPYYEAGKKLYYTRFGQMNMSCDHCHDVHTGKMLRGQKLSQGHTNGFPEYRLEAQKMINLPQRLRECFRSLRAETFEQDSDEFRDLEIYLNARGNGLPIETPAIRY